MTAFRPLLAIGLVVAILVALMHIPGVPVKILSAGALVVFAIVSWTFGLLAEPLTTLTFFLLVVLFHVATPEVVFSGFTSSAWWLLFGGSVTAIAVDITGLGKRLASLLFQRWTRYTHAVIAVAIASVALAFVMPSTLGRTLLLMPIVMAYAEGLGLQRGQSGWTGIIFTAAAVTYMPSTAILPANIPNSILMGGADTLYGIKLTYAPYLLLHFPVLGILKTAVLIGVVCWFCPEPMPLREADNSDVGPMSGEEKRLSWILAGSLLLYVTDSFHGISPAWIALGAGILCLLPPIGMIPAKMLSQKLNFISLIYIAGILSIGAVVADSGLGEAISTKFLELAHLTPGDTATNVAAVSGLYYILTTLTGVTGAPAVLTPVAGQLADATGLPILTVLMLEVIAFSTVLFPYASPPTLIGLQMGGVKTEPAMKMLLIIGGITVVVLFPIDYVWWRLLGYLP
jgi:anion transporter